MKYAFPALLVCLLLVVIQCHGTLVCMTKCPRKMKECVSLNKQKTKDCATYKCVMEGYKLRMKLISYKCRSSSNKCHANGSWFRHKVDKKTYRCQCKISGNHAQFKSCTQYPPGY